MSFLVNFWVFVKNNFYQMCTHLKLMSYVVPINILFNTDVMWDVMNATQWTPGLHPESSALHPDKTCNRDFIYGIFIVKNKL